jgi:Cys-tRNA(Pro) deacylase
MQPLTPAHVQQTLDDVLPGAKVTFFDESTATSQQAADAIGCELGQIVKSLAFMVDGTPILVLASGDQRVDDRKLATHYEVGRKKVKTATPAQCVEIYGYAPGGVPPVAHRRPLPTYIDDSLKRYQTVYAAAGAHNAIFPLTFDALVEITDGTVMDVKKE